MQNSKPKYPDRAGADQGHRREVTKTESDTVELTDGEELEERIAPGVRKPL